ncbi:metallophosphoesterase [Allohahella marinimesophila]
MKIQLYSDLHIEFAEFEATTTDADVLVLAGDIEIGAKGLEWLKRLGSSKPVIYVLGNHEYYGKTYPKLVPSLKALISEPNIHVLENESVMVDGVTFHGCTLWTDYELFGDPRSAGFECQQVMTDFRKIRRLPNYSRIRAMDIAAIHRESLTWLGNSLAASQTPRNVVVTHHAPSIRSIAEELREDIVSAAYASNLEDFIEQHAPDVWLHGHLHNSSDYHIGECRVMCNPRGYKGEFNPRFDLSKLIDVE